VVADRGPGVAPGERDRIFERFYRGQAAGQRGVTSGTGLGLSLVVEHVRLHGGRVWAESGAGGENRFVVELPTGDHNGRVALHPSDAGAEAGSDSP
jgi:signal transduction histidine kinase